MGWSDDIVTTYLDKDVLLPAIGQGALGIECRSDDKELLELLKKCIIKMSHNVLLLNVPSCRRWMALPSTHRWVRHYRW